MIEESKSTVDIIQDQSNESGDSGNQNSSNNGDVSLNPDNLIDEDLPQIGGITQPGNSGNQDSSNRGDSSVNSDKPVEEKLPQTGDTTNWGLWFTLILVEAGIVIVYINKDRWKKCDRKYRKMIMLLIVGGLSLQVIGTVTAAASSFSSKGELNGDGQIDYTDVHLLELYLIHQDEITDSTIKNADMNRDGNINVTDLSLLVKKIEKTLDYKVDLYDAGQGNYYPNKNDEVNLIFVGDV